MDSEKFSEHFLRAEFEKDGAMPQDAADCYRELCTLVLEPIRENINTPLVITSGYRPPDANAAAGGVKNSQHVATATYCAADFEVNGKTDLRELFDWIRAESGIRFDQVILEHGHSGDIIHISWSRAYLRREALEGATHNLSAYRQWPSHDPGPVNA